MTDLGALRLPLGDITRRAATIDAIRPRADALDALLRLLRDSRGDVRAGAAIAIGQLGLVGGLDALDRVARQDTFGAVAFRAAESARSLRTATGRTDTPAPRPSSEWIGRLVNDLGHAELRADAALALSEIGDAALGAWLASGPIEPKTNALLGSERVTALLVAHARAHVADAAIVVSRAARDRDPRALAWIAAPSEPVEIRMALAAHLEQVPGDRARELLETLVDSAEPAVVRRAAIALMTRGERVPLAPVPRPADAPLTTWRTLEQAQWLAILRAIPGDAFTPAWSDEVHGPRRDLRALPSTKPGWTHEISTERWDRGQATLTITTDAEWHPHAGGGAQVEVTLALPGGIRATTTQGSTELRVDAPTGSIDHARALLASVLDALGWRSRDTRAA
jgi:hypothetical protein